jgi:hypothetical protein
VLGLDGDCFHIATTSAFQTCDNSTPPVCLGQPSGGARVWEGNDQGFSAPQQVLPLNTAAGDVDQLFPTISVAINPIVGVNYYVAFYTRFDLPAANHPDPYKTGFPGVGNSNLNYTVTRNTLPLQSGSGASPEAVNANGSPMPLPLLLNGDYLTAYTQAVADQTGVHVVYVDTRGNGRNQNFPGGESITVAYLQ